MFLGGYKDEVWIRKDVSGKWDLQWKGFLSSMRIK